MLVPCYNEAIAIGKVVADFKAALPTATIYVYDNNSTDDTFEVARQYGAVVRREMLQGKGNVIRRMFADIDADVYVMVDGDATYDALPHRPWLKNYCQSKWIWWSDAARTSAKRPIEQVIALGICSLPRLWNFCLVRHSLTSSPAIVHSPAALSKVSLRRQAGLKQRQSLLSTAYKCGYVPEK